MRQIPTAISRREPFWRSGVVAVALLVVGACAFRAIYKSGDGDFKLHWEFGRRLLAGEFLYAGGHHIPYPPFWAMAHAPFALLSMPVAKALFFPIGVGALLVLLWILRRLVETAFPTERANSFWVAALALFLTARFIVRDMAELGVNTLLVMLSWLGIYFWVRRRELMGGASLGLAIALKCTPAIFVAYFLWKRQWRMVGATAAAALLFSLAPVLWQGPASYREHMATWSANVAKGFGAADPSAGVLGAERIQNMALRPTLARYLMRLPPDHPGRAQHPLYCDVLNLPPVLAGWVIRITLLALLAALMWWTRRPIAARDDPQLLWECAAVSIAMLLFSPITWGQHCVALIPACYFVSTLLVARREWPPRMMGLLAFYILFVVLLSRDLVGRDVSLLLASYHVETLSILGLLVVVWSCARWPAGPAQLGGGLRS